MVVLLSSVNRCVNMLEGVVQLGVSHAVVCEHEMSTAFVRGSPKLSWLDRIYAARRFSECGSRAR